MSAKHTEMRHLVEAVAAAYAQDADAHTAHGWQVERYPAGMNGLIYRVTSADNTNTQAPLAIKISKRDERRRVEREFGAQRALWWSGIEERCPYPVMFFEEPDGLPGDVLVSQWLAGEPLSAAPAPDDKATWNAILAAFADVHHLTQTDSAVTLRPSVIPVLHPQALIDEIKHRRAYLPEEADDLGLFTRADLDARFPAIVESVPVQWQIAPLHALTLSDSNPENMILHEGRVRFVDWENSGWCDGAFDIADMLAQPSYVGLPESHKAWIRQNYAVRMDDESTIERIQVYEKLMYFFWVIGATYPMVGYYKNKLSGTRQYPLEHYQRLQRDYWQRLQSLAG